MSTKSQKTEDMLDQTFANFDSEVTGAETQQTQAADVKGGGAKKSNNMIVFIGAGVAAVGAVGYLFFIKPMLAPAPQAPRTEIKAPVSLPKPVEQKPAEVAPVAQNPVEQKPAEVAPVVAPANPVNPAEPVAAKVETPAVANNPANPPSPLDVKAEAPVNAAMVNQPAKVEAVVPAKVETPKVETAKVEAPKVAGVNAQSVAVVDDLKSMFDKQTSEFKTVLTDIDSRVGTLESAVTEQKDLNNKFDQRITALESKKPVAAVKTVKTAPVDGAEAPTAPVHAKAKAHHSKKKVAVVKAKASADASVLIDKSTEVQKAKVESVKTEKAEKSNLPQIALHSIYGGRLWVKNTDGSLSTFSAGDRLPTGETIKSIDDEKFEVHTDKRVLKN
jgi:hypothetical protein